MDDSVEIIGSGGEGEKGRPWAYGIERCWRW